MKTVRRFFRRQRVDDIGKRAVWLEVLLFILIGLKSINLLTNLFTAQYFSMIISVLLLLVFIVGIFGAYKRNNAIILIYIVTMAIFLCLMVIGFVLLWIGLAEANQKEKNKLISDVPVGLIVFDGILTVIVAGIELVSIFIALSLSRALSGYTVWWEFCFTRESEYQEDEDEEEQSDRYNMYRKLPIDAETGMVELQEPVREGHVTYKGNRRRRDGDHEDDDDGWSSFSNTKRPSVAPTFNTNHSLVTPYYGATSLDSPEARSPRSTVHGGIDNEQDDIMRKKKQKGKEKEMNYGDEEGEEDIFVNDTTATGQSFSREEEESIFASKSGKMRHKRRARQDKATLSTTPEPSTSDASIVGQDTSGYTNNDTPTNDTTQEGGRQIQDVNNSAAAPSLFIHDEVDGV